MYRIFYFFLFLSFPFFLKAQDKPYFQQTVDYKIEANLNDSLHLLDANIEITYTNNSKEELTFLYMHLWPNAYKNKNTAFGKQTLENGSSNFFYAKEEDRGYINEMDFEVDGEKASLEIDDENIDIAILRLPQSIKPGQSILIKTPFKVKIPKSYSRMGHVGQSYQMTQWFPKPAVYDRDGWHPMPYLNQGEFYSEFGSFDVKITLPENYVVGATGTLQNESEIEWLKEKAKKSAPIISGKTALNSGSKEKHAFPASASKTKTLHYKADKIHDFAWFADKRFYVMHSNVELQSGKKVDTWAMFTDKEAHLWKDATKYLNRSVKYYSDKVGEYPYPHATAVQSALSAGAGMEYPMITVIGVSGNAQGLDIVITHEIGHNWFYGILASNERLHPWMDEGFNSYIERRYTKVYYPKSQPVIGDLPERLLRLIGGKDFDINWTLFQMQSRRNRHQCVDTHSAELSGFNYFVCCYHMPPVNLNYLEDFVGTEMMDKMMHAYFDKWKFKHPGPEDIQAVFEATCGKNLDWFFKDLIETLKPLDYKLVSAKSNKIVVKNKGKIVAPFSVSGVIGDSIVDTKYFDGFEGIKEFDFKTEDYDRVQIDAQQVMPEHKRSNNFIKKKGLFKRAAPQLKLLGSIEDPKKKTLYVAPVVGMNYHDGFMAGLGFYNTVFPQKRLEFSDYIMYGTKSGNIVGISSLDWHLQPEGLQRLTLGYAAKSFSTRDFDSTQTRFAKFSPKIEVEFREKRMRSPYAHVLRLQSNVLYNEYSYQYHPGMDIGDNNKLRFFHQLDYEMKMKHTLNPLSVKARLLGERYAKGTTGEPITYLKLTAEMNYHYSYNKKKLGMDIRLFGGQFLFNQDINFGSFPLSMTSQNYNDYYFENHVFGRNVGSGLMAQQVFNTEGGFKALINPLNDDRAVSNSTLIALNFQTDIIMRKLPLGMHIRAYVDWGAYLETTPYIANNLINPFQSVWNSGLSLSYFNDVIQIHFPLLISPLTSRNLHNPDPANSPAPSVIGKMVDGEYMSKVSFQVNLQKWNPFRMIKNLAF